jgi:hypothetical protein
VVFYAKKQLKGRTMNLLYCLEKLTWRVMIVIAYPFVLMQSGYASPIENTITQYPSELILSACIVCWILGSLLGAYYPVPEELQQKPMSINLKILVSFTGGIVAFIYLISVDKALILINALWIGGVSFVAPAIIQAVQSLLIRSILNFLPKPPNEGK